MSIKCPAVDDLKAEMMMRVMNALAHVSVTLTFWQYNCGLLFILSITSSSLSKRKRHRISASTPKSSNEERVLDASTWNENDESKNENTASSKKDKFKSRGTVRKIFALETAFQESSSNVVCSPVSALLPLGKLALGAEGKSYAELSKMVGESSNTKLSKAFKKLIKCLKFTPGVTLDIASRIYVSDDVEIKSKFIEASKDIFESGVHKLSFSDPERAANEINEWVSKQTKGLIPTFLTSNQISKHSALFIVNAIYFKGKWKDPFTKVAVDDFHSPTGQKKVPFMTRKHTKYNYTKCEILDSQIIEIPYEESEASFIIVLPNKTHGLPLLLNQLKLAPGLLNTAMRNMQPRKVALTIPKFKITTSLDLKDMYKKIGMKHTLQRNSGLTGIAQNQELRISSAIQKAVIEVHERGTEAAAASGVNMIVLSSPLNAVQFYADHPFLFYVQTRREQLFAGIFNAP